MLHSNNQLLPADRSEETQSKGVAVSYEDTKSRQIAVSVGVQLAAELAAAAASSGQDPFALFEAYASGVVETVVNLQAEYAIKDSFPGTVTAAPVTIPPTAPTMPVAPVLAFRPPTAPVAAAPVAIPGVTDGDPAVASLWVDFFDNQSSWYNNINGKRNPKAPDFKHKTQGTAETGNKNLWINDKKNPSWVANALRQNGLVG